MFVGERAFRFSVVDRNRLSKTGRFGQADITRHDSGRDGIPKVRFYFVHHLVRQIGAAVKKRQNHLPHGEVRVQPLAHPVNNGKELGDSFEGVILALQRNQHLIGGGQGIDRNQAQRRRRVNKDIVVLVGDLGERAFQAVFAFQNPVEFHFRARQIDSRRNQVQITERCLDAGIGDGLIMDEDGVDVRTHRATVNTEAAGRVPLWVRIYQQYPTSRCDIRRQINRRGGFPDPALLIDNRPDKRHALLYPHFRLSEPEKRRFPEGTFHAGQFDGSIGNPFPTIALGTRWLGRGSLTKTP